ncbi:MAG: PIN domain-containing protein [Methylohalobius sp.]|nr:PIN domain-containing protein [Methylohalobius sp.]
MLCFTPFEVDSEEATMLDYMFDTNIFNRILDGAVELTKFRPKARFYAAHVQLDELEKTSNSQRRQELISVFEKVLESNNKIPTESFILGVSRLDEAKLGDEKNDLYSKIKAELDKRNKNKPNNIQDALIAETAIKNNITQVTEDADLQAVTKSFGGKCANIKEMLAELED